MEEGGKRRREEKLHHRRLVPAQIVAVAGSPVEPHAAYAGGEVDATDAANMRKSSAAAIPPCKLHDLAGGMLRWQRSWRREEEGGSSLVLPSRLSHCVRAMWGGGGARGLAPQSLIPFMTVHPQG